jgi:O-antigen ligase
MRGENPESAGRWGWKVATYCLHLVVLVVPMITTYTFGLDPGRVALTNDSFALAKWSAGIVLVVVGIAAWAWGSYRSHRPVRWHPALWALVALIAWSFVTAAAGTNWRTSLLGEYGFYNGISSLLAGAGVLFLAMQLTDRPSRMASLARSAIIGGTLAAAYGLVQYTGHDPVHWVQVTWEPGRIFGTFGNPDPFATYLLVPFALAPIMALYEARSNLVRAAYWLSFLLCGVVIAAARVRGAWLAALCVLVGVVLFAWEHRVSVKRFDFAVLGGGIAGAVVLFFLTPGAAGRWSKLWYAATRVFGTTLDVDTNGRMSIWSALLRGAMHRPILGYGPDQVAVAFSEFHSAAFVAKWGAYTYASSAHNFLLQYLVTMGIPGLLLILTVVVGGLAEGAKALSNHGSDPRLLPATGWWLVTFGLVVGLLSSPVDSGTHAFVWIGCGLMLSFFAHKVDIAMAARRAIVVATVAFAFLAVFTVGRVVYADAVFNTALTVTSGADIPRVIERAVALNPFNAQYRVELGTQYMLLGRDASDNSDMARAKADGESAENALETAVRFAPYDERAWDRLVQLHGAELDWGVVRDPHDAAEMAREMLQRFPINPPASFVLAKAYVEEGQLPSAEDALNRALIATPNSADVQFLLSYIKSREGK